MKAISVATNYQLIFSIKDKHFSMDYLAQYYLTISIGRLSFRICCIDSVTNQCLLLEVYKLDHSLETQHISTIEQLYHNHPWLASKVWHTAILCIENQQYTLIPRPLFQEKDATSYLKLASCIDSNTVQHCAHPHLDLVVAFGVEPWLLKWFQATYDQSKRHIIHQASSLIEGILTYLQAKGLGVLPRLFVLVELEHMHITVIKASNLLYYNRFMYTDSDELLQYILIVMNTLNLDPNMLEVILGGNITPHSSAYRKARNYIANIFFIDRPICLKFQRAFKKNIITKHFDLFHAHLCQKSS